MCVPRSVREGIRALVVIDHEPLATFLQAVRKSKPHPVAAILESRRTMSKQSSLVSFVINSVREICNLVSAENREVDKRLLSDIFPMPDR